MPVVSYAAVSISPLMVAVACQRGGFTYKLIVKSKSFSLCILDSAYVKPVGKLATFSGSKVKDKLAEVGFDHEYGAKLKVPLIRGSSAGLECKLVRRVITGDQILIIGEVVAARASEDFSDSWSFKKYKPILYTGWKRGMTTYSCAQ